MRPEPATVRFYPFDAVLETLAALLREAGFAEVERIDGVYYQPVLLAR